ncbi:MAG: PAS domain-containing sensor histidine kinase [Ilyomonas sp.]
MKQQAKTYEELIEEVHTLQTQLDEANETIYAIRTGQIDALIVQEPHGHQLYTLKTADQTYRVFIEKMNEGAVTLNKNEMILYANSRFASIVNTPLTKVTGVPFNTFIPEACKAAYNALIKKGWQTESKGEIYFYDENNKPVPYLLSVTTLELDEGSALSVILTDLSSQKEIEKRLKKQNKALKEAQLTATRLNNELEDKVKERTRDLFISREYFSFLADNIPVIVWTSEPNGAINYCNRRWYNYTGLTFEQTKAVGWQHVVHPDDKNRVLDEWGISVKTGVRFETEVRIKSGDNLYRFHLAQALPFKDSQGNITTWIGTLTDIEDQKRAMQKKDEFISIASHELKTPLTSLKGYMQLVESHKNQIPHLLHSFLVKAERSVKKLDHLIADLLDVSKIQAGKLEFDKTIINIEELVNECVENASQMYPSFTIVKRQVKKVLIKGNFERLEQVMMNLINNAVKYSSANKEIIVSTTETEGHVTVSVTDFGLGLSLEDKDKVFERFYRVEDKKFLTSGLGMGLYISAEIIKAHGGCMQVESKLNSGSTFSFSLPVYVELNS